MGNADRLRQMVGTMTADQTANAARIFIEELSDEDFIQLVVEVVGADECLKDELAVALED